MEWHIQVDIVNGQDNIDHLYPQYQKSLIPLKADQPTGNYYYLDVILTEDEVLLLKLKYHDFDIIKYGAFSVILNFMGNNDINTLLNNLRKIDG